PHALLRGRPPDAVRILLSGRRLRLFRLLYSAGPGLVPPAVVSARRSASLVRYTYREPNRPQLPRRRCRLIRNLESLTDEDLVTERTAADRGGRIPRAGDLLPHSRHLPPLDFQPTQ